MKQPHLYSEAVQPIDVDEAGTVHVRTYGDPDAFDAGDAVNPFAALAALMLLAVLFGACLGALAALFAAFL